LVISRKEIQRLRSELSSTLEEITNCNTKLGCKFDIFVAWNCQDEKIRNYCWDVEKKLVEATHGRGITDF